MSEDSSILIMPYTSVVGQEQLKLALELAYIAPRIGGVLISGERGTGKSTTVRAFARMLYDHLPVTIPINATEDRVIGGWKIDELVRGHAEPQKGLLEEAADKLLYIDEVNLLDDHIVNIILDVTSTGVLVIQREGKDEQKQIKFTLVGTMNPEEGGLRPQLLDRFGLMVNVRAESDLELRRRILLRVLEFDEALYLTRHGQPNPFFETATQETQKCKAILDQAHQNLYHIEIPEKVVSTCIRLIQEFAPEGHRADYLLVLAAQACAARSGHKVISLEDVRKIAPLVLQHRRPEAKQLSSDLWREEDEKRLTELLNHA